MNERYGLTFIPNFLLKKIYQKGSLRETKDGIAFDLKNILGPGLITGINFVKINDKVYNSSVIKIIKSGVKTLAEKVSSENPMIIKLNEEITCVMKSGFELQKGINDIILELVSDDVGKVRVKLSDIVTI